MNEQFVGVNVTPEMIEIVVRPSGEHWSLDSGEPEISKVAERLCAIDPQIVVLPSRGQVELPVAQRLVAAGLRCAFVPPLQIREFAKAIGKFSYVENHQAELLARFAELVRPEQYSISEERVERLRDVMRRRQELLTMIETERSRLEKRTPSVRRNIREHLDFLLKKLRQVEGEANSTVRASPFWR